MRAIAAMRISIDRQREINNPDVETDAAYVVELEAKLAAKGS